MFIDYFVMNIMILLKFWTDLEFFCRKLIMYCCSYRCYWTSRGSSWGSNGSSYGEREKNVQFFLRDCM